MYETHKTLERLPSMHGNNGDEEFNWWRGALEQQCREHRDDLEAAFPWLKLSAHFEFQATTNEGADRQLRELWREINSIQRVGELESYLARADELLISLAASPDGKIRNLLAELRGAIVA